MTARASSRSSKRAARNSEPKPKPRTRRCEYGRRAQRGVAIAGFAPRRHGRRVTRVALASSKEHPRRRRRGPHVVLTQKLAALEAATALVVG